MTIAEYMEDARKTMNFLGYSEDDIRALQILIPMFDEEQNERLRRFINSLSMVKRERVAEIHSKTLDIF